MTSVNYEVPIYVIFATPFLPHAAQEK